MTELDFPYLNTLSSQLLFICAFLGGFSATLLGTLITSDKEGRVMRTLIIASAVSAVSFIVAVLSMTGILLVTTEGYPLEISNSDVTIMRGIGALTMVLGIIGLLMGIGVSGWLRNRRLGYITSGIALMGFVLIILIS